MVHRVLTSVAILFSSLIIASLGMFARDQLEGASIQQQNLVAASGNQRQVAVPVAHRPGQPRRLIDGVAARLTAPFSGLVHTDSEWADRLVPALAGLLVWGVGLGYLARFSRGLARGPRPHPSGAERIAQ